MNFSTALSLLKSPTVIDRNQVLAYQQKQLRRLIDHAYHNVPYYRRLFDDNRLKPTDIRTVADLSLIPITTRKVFQSLPPSDLIARGVSTSHLIVRNSGGSTGQPIKIYRSWWEERLLNQIRRQTLKVYGLRRQDHQVLLTWSKYHDLMARINARLQFYRRTVVDCDAPLPQIASILADLQPDILSGYAGVLAALTKYVDQLEPNLRRKIKPRFLVCGADMLSPLMRQQLTNTFNVPTYDQYGAIEFNLLAWQCPHSTDYHICENSLILEVLDNNQPVAVGASGEVIGTNLHMFSAPIIRYQLGDRVVRGDNICSCGQQVATLKQIQGRNNDYFLLLNGGISFYFSIAAVFLISAWIAGFQLTQYRIDYFILQLELHRMPQKAELAAIYQGFRELFGDAKLDIVFVDQLPFEANNKFRMFRSLITDQNK